MRPLSVRSSGPLRRSCPGGTLQERQINAVYFLNKYGPDFMSKLARDLDITEAKHQVIIP